MSLVAAMKRRRLLEERIEWLETFPRKVTVGELLRSLRMVANITDVAVGPQEASGSRKADLADRLLREDR
jgi:hypothetical protein